MQTFLDYQVRAHETAVYPGSPKGNDSCPSLAYLGLKLAGEAGEVSEKIGKLFRDAAGEITDDQKLEMAKELGDVLWYVSAIATVLGLKLNQIAQLNIAKLRGRQAANKLHGSGDNR